MSEERIANLLEEIRDLQNRQLELSRENSRAYREASKVNKEILELSRENSRTYHEASEAHEKAVRRGRKGQVVFFALLLVFLMFVIYAEWFGDGLPKPSWVK